MAPGGTGGPKCCKKDTAVSWSAKKLPGGGVSMGGGNFHLIPLRKAPVPISGASQVCANKFAGTKKFHVRLSSPTWKIRSGKGSSIGPTVKEALLIQVLWVHAIPYWAFLLLSPPPARCWWASACSLCPGPSTAALVREKSLSNCPEKLFQ